MQKCQRCGNESQSFGFSIFNTQMLCISCFREERDHPDFKKAKDCEYEEIIKGNLNFYGIGLPEDLSKKYAETSTTYP